MAKMSSVLDSLIAAELSSKPAAPTVKTTTRSQKNATTATAPTVTPTVKATTTPVPTHLKIAGCSMAFAAGLPETVKDAVARETKNPWYPLAVWLCEQVPGHITISRDGDAKSFKSPMTQIDAAIARCRKQNVKNYGKLDAKSSTEKDVWFFIRRV